MCFVYPCWLKTVDVEHQISSFPPHRPKFQCFVPCPFLGQTQRVRNVGCGMLDKIDLLLFHKCLAERQRGFQ